MNVFTNIGAAEELIDSLPLFDFGAEVVEKRLLMDSLDEFGEVFFLNLDDNGQTCRYIVSDINVVCFFMSYIYYMYCHSIHVVYCI